MYEHLLVKTEGDTVRITMNRPARRNSLSHEHLSELLAAFRAAGETDATGVVLAGEGPVFSAGHDFGDVASRDLMGVRELLRQRLDAVLAEESASFQRRAASSTCVSSCRMGGG